MPIMTDSLSVLPTELLLLIFAHLSMSDLLASLCYVNKRLRSVCLSHRRFNFNFDSYAKRKRQFQSVCTHLPLVSSELVSLTFADESNRLMSLKIALFSSRFLAIADSFSKLRSVSLSSLDSSTWRSINPRLTSLPSLVSLSIRCPTKLELSVASELLGELLFDSRSLKRLQVKVSVESREALIFAPRPESRVSQIEDLSLQGIRVELKSLFSFTPTLQSLNVSLILFQFRPHTRFDSPANIRHLTISVNFIRLEEIEVMLNSLKQLTHLTMISKNVEFDMADGWTWSSLLKSVLVFKFFFTFDQYTFTLPPFDLTSFRTPFWLEKKRWFVTCERCIDTGFSILYSDPFSLDEDPFFFVRNTLIIDSTAPQATVLPTPTHLMADYPYPMKLVLALREAYPQVTRSSLADCGTSLQSKVDYAMEHLQLSQINFFSAIQCETDLSADVFVNFLQQLPRLSSLHLSMSLLKRLLTCEWSQILDLRLSTNPPGQDAPLTSVECEAFCRSFLRLEHLSVSIDLLPDLSLLLSKITTMSILRNILIVPSCQAPDQSNGPIIDRDWLEKNTQLPPFHYSREEHGTINLWFE